MKAYSVQTLPWSSASDSDVALIVEGFSWPALIFGPFWALWHGLWRTVIVWVVMVALIISDTLKNLLSKFPENFVQIHKSYVISLDHLEFVEGNQAKVRGSMIPIGQFFRKKMKEIL